MRHEDIELKQTKPYFTVSGIEKEKDSPALFRKGHRQLSVDGPFLDMKGSRKMGSSKYSSVRQRENSP